MQLLSNQKMYYLQIYKIFQKKDKKKKKCFWGGLVNTDPDVHGCRNPLILKPWRQGETEAVIDGMDAGVTSADRYKGEATVTIISFEIVCVDFTGL